MLQFIENKVILITLILKYFFNLYTLTGISPTVPTPLSATVPGVAISRAVFILSTPPGTARTGPGKLKLELDYK